MRDPEVRELLKTIPDMIGDGYQQTRLAYTGPTSIPRAHLLQREGRLFILPDTGGLLVVKIKDLVGFLAAFEA